MIRRQEVLNKYGSCPVLYRWMSHHPVPFGLGLSSSDKLPSRDLSTLVLPTAQRQDSLIVVKAVLGSQVGTDRRRVLGAFADDPGLTVEADLFREEKGWDLRQATWEGDGLEPQWPSREGHLVTVHPALGRGSMEENPGSVNLMSLAHR